jgi:hypothetical protein
VEVPELPVLTDREGSPDLTDARELVHELVARLRASGFQGRLK